MEEKLLEIMDENEKSLNKNKEELQKVIEEEITKHKMELKEGKFEKTTEQSECEKDLTKIEKELDNIVKDREILEDKQKKEKEISEEKKIVKKLTINKKECEEAIKEEQGKYSFSEGKFTKTPVLLEYEKDLEKINRELNSKLLGIVKQEKELETLKSDVDKMMKKYNVKSQMKEEKEATTENKEQREIKTEENEVKFEVGPYLGKENEFVDKNSTKDKQEKTTPTTFETKIENKKQKEDEVKFEIEPYLGKENEFVDKDSTKDKQEKTTPTTFETKTENKKQKEDEVKFEIDPYLWEENEFVDKDSTKNEQKEVSNEIKKEEKDNIIFPKRKQFQSVTIDDKGNIIPSSVINLQEGNRDQEKNAKERNRKLIEINEYDGEIIYIDEKNQEKSIDISEALENSKENFEKLKISKKCREIAGGIIKGALLKRKINPEIVEVFKDDEEQLEEYISCIKDKKELPFELIHNLEKLNVVEKILLNKFTKAEEKSKAVILGKIFDKNKALNSARANELKEIIRPKNIKKKSRDFVGKVYNKDSRIEANAREALEQKGLESNLDNKGKEIVEDQEIK